MRDTFRHFLLATCVVLVSTLICVTQERVVSIRVPRKVIVDSPIHAVVVNALLTQISMCVDIGASIVSPLGEKEPAPHPFIIEKSELGKWSDLLVATDVGNARAPITIDAGESTRFDVQIHQPGRYRLSIHYLDRPSSEVTHCPLSDNDRSKTSTSAPFWVSSKVRKEGRETP